MFKFLFGTDPKTTIIGIVIGAITAAPSFTLKGIGTGLLISIFGRLTNEKTYKP